MASSNKHNNALASKVQGIDKVLPFFLCVALVLFITGLILPVVQVKQLWLFKHQVSIISAQLTLLKAHQVFLFLLVFVFSLIFPLVKMVMLFILWFFMDIHHKGVQRFVYWSTLLSKWSMLDVFVLALVIVLAKLKLLANAVVHPGLYAFVFAIILSSFISHRMHVLALRKRKIKNENH